METEYLFDEIHVLGEGLLASGKAILTSAGAGYEGEFYVSSITLDRGPTIRRDILKMPPSLEQFVFQNVARQIEDSRDAQSEWDDFEEGLKQPDPDRLHDERRDRAAMGWL
ncbi:hypothetical protein ACFFP0_24795 [Rhizobium puerariae]|uniref:Uncharacterized protein n=1 Tax=Rhizobium puerariae TaxID=1585791 RepID=A0ABV6AN78_9HYPH